MKPKTTANPLGTMVAFADMPSPMPDLAAAPMHGFRGDPGGSSHEHRPRSLTVCITREAGARGSSIARRVGELLGWQVFDQELLAYLTNNEAARQEVFSDLPATARVWAHEQYEHILNQQRPLLGAESADLARLILCIAARGEAVLVGRSAGAWLPVETTLNVRVVAPLQQRIGYISQWLRLPMSEAAEEVAARDRVRDALHTALTNRDPADPTQYDLVLNSGRIGEAGCAELIAEAIRGKHIPIDPFATPSEMPLLEPVG